MFPTGEGEKRQGGKKCGYIPPVTTRPFCMSMSDGTSDGTSAGGEPHRHGQQQRQRQQRQRRAGAPEWKEQIVILESYATILSPRALLLFEVLDFGPTVPLKDAREGGGFLRVAWGFLKPRGARGSINVGVRRRPKGEEGIGVGVGGSNGVGVGGSNGGNGSNSNGSNSNGSSGTEFEGQNLAPSQKVCRLQLYKYAFDGPLVRSQAFYRGLPAFVPPPATPEVPPVFLQYLRQAGSRVAYAGTLTVVVGPVAKPKSQVVLRRARGAWERERHRLKFTEMEGAAGNAGEEGNSAEKTGMSQFMATAGNALTGDNAEKMEITRRGVMLRTRKPTEQCLLPTKLLSRLSAGKDGALTVKFNLAGNLIAIGCSEGAEGSQKFPVRIFGVSESGGMKHEFSGHHDLIYDLQWSECGRFLVSSSKDGTAKVWAMGNLWRPGEKEGVRGGGGRTWRRRRSLARRITKAKAL